MTSLTTNGESTADEAACWLAVCQPVCAGLAGDRYYVAACMIVQGERAKWWLHTGSICIHDIACVLLVYQLHAVIAGCNCSTAVALTPCTSAAVHAAGN